MNLKDRRVFVSLESSSIGDTIAWLPMVDKFQKRHNCELIVSTHHNEFFDIEKYPNLQFVKPTDIVYNLYAHYRIGVFDVDNRFIHPNHPLIVPLQQVASDRLGFHYEGNCRPEMKIKKNPFENHITLCIRSTAGSKEWQRKNGWKNLIMKLVKEDYSVDVIYKRPGAELKSESESLWRILRDLNINEDEYEKIKHQVTIVFNQSLEDVTKVISQSALFIGLPSGLSWVAWALEVPVIIISGFSLEYAEFEEQHRVQNFDVCNGCWNNPDFKFDKGDWYWCPKHKGTDRQFECTKQITEDAVYKLVAKILP